jgi:hypothetical protein
MGSTLPGSPRNGAFLSEESQCGGHLGRALLLGALGDMLRKALDTGISPHRGPVGESGGDSSVGTSERKGQYITGSFLEPRGHKDFHSGGHLQIG